MGKKEQVTNMFDKIAKSYDLLNHLLSFGIDKRWRKKAVNILQQNNPAKVLDVATGTGDFAFSISMSGVAEVVGVDLSEEMINVAKSKFKQHYSDKNIIFKLADAEKLPFDDNVFDAATVAFGVRNYENLEIGLKELYRVIKPGGKTVIIEFSKPKHFPFRNIYHLYFKYFVPFIGGIISKDKKAYRYLYHSVDNFPYGNNFIVKLDKAGFNNNKSIPLTFGIASIYLANKS